LWPAAALFVPAAVFMVNGQGVLTRLETLLSPKRELDLGHWSLHSRQTVAAIAFDAWRDAPWFGVGVGESLETIERLSAQRFHIRPHNTYLLVLMEQGVVGVLGLTTLAYSMVAAVLRPLRSQRAHLLDWTRRWLPSLLAVLFFALSADVLTFPLFWLLMAVALADAKTTAR